MTNFEIQKIIAKPEKKKHLGSKERVKFHKNLTFLSSVVVLFSSLGGNPESLFKDDIEMDLL